MASKSKKRSKGRRAVDPLDGIKRNLEKGDYKQALKDARVCYRQSPSAEHRCFLEHACMGRAQQLARNGLIKDSQRIVGELMDLGVTEPAVEAGLPDLLLSVGMLDSLPEGSSALAEGDRNRLRTKAADQAVVRPEHAPDSMRELQDEARRVRAALEAVEGGDDAAALKHLKAISRQSLMADWKYFVRGLIAYYRRDTHEMESNWGRLDVDRTAATIAEPLRVMAGRPTSDRGGRLRAKISRLEKEVTDQALLGSLERLRQSAAGHDWKQLFKTLRTTQPTLRRAEGDVYRRVTASLRALFVHEGLVRELSRFSKIVDPLPNDPRWNHAMALACENASYYEDDPNRYWGRYLADLEDLPSFSGEQRQLARGLVWLHLAEDYADDADHLRRCKCGADHTLDVEAVERGALSAFEQCLGLIPSYAPAYEAAADFHVAGERQEEAADIYERLLRQVGDHLEALYWLTEYHLAEDRALQAREFALRARQLRPLDEKTATLLWSAHIGVAREFGRTGRCDEAREAWAAADRVLPKRANDYDVLAQKAVLEIKAGDAGAARRFVEEAQERLEEHAALWLVMALEAAKYELPKEETWLYEERWRKALKCRCRSSTAGLMCRKLIGPLQTRPESPTLKIYSKDLMGYVRRCTRVKWALEDLRDVCRFLETTGNRDLLLKFAKKGLRRFPNIGYFHFLMGREEMAKGPFAFNRARTIEWLERALELTSGSTDPRDKDVQELARRLLSMAEGVAPLHGPVAPEECEDDDPQEKDGSAEAISDEDLRAIIERTCGEMGLDPNVVLDEIRRRS